MAKQFIWTKVRNFDEVRRALEEFKFQTILNLSDLPDAYTGYDDYVLQVNDSENGLEFTNEPTFNLVNIVDGNSQVKAVSGDLVLQNDGEIRFYTHDDTNDYIQVGRSAANNPQIESVHSGGNTFTVKGATNLTLTSAATTLVSGTTAIQLQTHDDTSDYIQIGRSAANNPQIESIHGTGNTFTVKGATNLTLTSSTTTLVSGTDVTLSATDDIELNATDDIRLSASGAGVIDLDANIVEFNGRHSVRLKTHDDTDDYIIIERSEAECPQIRGVHGTGSKFTIKGDMDLCLDAGLATRIFAGTSMQITPTSSLLLSPGGSISMQTENESTITIDSGGILYLRSNDDIEIDPFLSTSYVKIKGRASFENFADIDEITAPAAPGVDIARLYAADDGGTTKLYYKTSTGTVELYDNWAEEAFKTIVPTTGSDVVADSATDTLTLISSSGAISITGTAAFDQLDFDVVEANVDHDSLDNVHQDVNTTASPSFVAVTTSGDVKCDELGLADDNQSHHLLLANINTQSSDLTLSIDTGDASLTLNLAGTDDYFLQYDNGSSSWLAFDLFGTANTWTAINTFADDTDLQFGSSTDVKIRWDTSQSWDSLQIGIGVGSSSYTGTLSLVAIGHLGHANRDPGDASTHPRLRVYSSDFNQADDYIELRHDATDGVIEWGNGSLRLVGSVVYIGDESGDVTLHLKGATNWGQYLWDASEDYLSVFDDILIVSDEKIYLRDTAIYVQSGADGQIDLVADTTANIFNATTTVNLGTAATTVTIGAVGNIVLGQDGTSIVMMPDTAGEVDLGQSGDEFGTIWTQDCIRLKDLSSDPAKPADGYAVVWCSDGTGLGDAGDVIIASSVSGTTKYTIVHDYSAGTTWS